MTANLAFGIVLIAAAFCLGITFGSWGEKRWNPRTAPSDIYHLGSSRNLTFEALIAANLSRVERWHSLQDWTPLEWAGAMCGEAGEAANAAKKLRRVEGQIANHDGRLFGVDMSLEEQRALYRKQVGLEVADSIIYGVLLCARAGADLPASIREAFNKKSEEYGFPERL